MKFYIRTLGCKMNALDSARVAAALQAAGHELVGEAEAEYVFVNTCTVTAEADRKSRKEVNAAGRVVEQVAVMGCGPRVDTGRWRQYSPGTMVFTDETALYERFGVQLDELPFPLGSRTRLPVAIQTGCDNLCSFCITRVARGPHANLPAEQVIRQVREAEEAGIREIVLTGINLAAWGAEDSNRAEQARLHLLIERILRETEMPRIRLSSLGPQYLHKGFFDLFSDPRLCAYLHLSLQSGSGPVLERMVRGHGTEEARRIAEQARRVRPDVALAADVIAGFPEESDTEHRETLAFIKQLGFAKLHVFPYSVREGTPAAEMAQVNGNIRRERAAEIRELGRQLRRDFIGGQMGERFDVLVERGKSGLTGNYIRLRVPDEAGFAGTIRQMTLTEETLAERL
ncbi:MiaB/RimO family radical SAM methylthiotransferase [Thiohalomonas denitrificans]|uniref:MiaB/RimO family radical SAM methylthiotransferase n=1 Tax=Thiohalomonas denitrificans TaxID=415747 RepID=UPI0026EC039F|nr:MiaB/RimO family radical SAM methylthiotransferase [Thiohalomonas denitrificans]